MWGKEPYSLIYHNKINETNMIDNNILKIYFKNVRNTRNQIVGSGTYVGEYPIDRLSDFGLEKSQIVSRKS